MRNEETKTFDELRGEFHLTETTESRKKELIQLMRENLKERCGKDHDTIECLGGNEYSLDSDNPSELYAINAALRAAETSKQSDMVSEEARKAMLRKNTYGPDNTYNEK